MRNRQVRLNALRFLRILDDASFASLLTKFESAILAPPGKDAQDIAYSRPLQIQYQETLLYLTDKSAYEKWSSAGASSPEIEALVKHAIDERDWHCVHLLGSRFPTKLDMDRYAKVVRSRLARANRKLIGQLLVMLATLNDETFLARAWKHGVMVEANILVEAYGVYADLANLNFVVDTFINNPSTPRGPQALLMMGEIAIAHLKKMLADKSLFKRETLHEIGCRSIPNHMKAVYTAIISSSDKLYELEKAIKYSPWLNDRELNELIAEKSREWAKSSNKKISELGKQMKPGLLAGIKQFFK